MDIKTKVRLNNGVMMPILGLGVYQTKTGEETLNAVSWALSCGYRQIDTAQIYGNETEVGQAIANSGILRKEVFITTKLWNADHGYDKTLRAFESSLNRLKTDYLDLYLIHWPEGNFRKDTWKAFEKLYNDKLIKAIGVSNYTVRHLNELLSYCNVAPAVNQVEFNPYLYQKELLEFCESNSIKLEAYSPIARGEKLKDEKLKMLSSKYDKTPAQMMLRWEIQHGIIVIPKSAHKERIEENANIFDFEISDDDMESIDSFNENFRTCWDPSNVK
jgi:diketogulonate reductase-like aldo/keto reductase